MKNMYNPNPLATSNILLPESLIPLIEDMAKHVHEVWAKKRIEDGWTYGHERNDEYKTHPCLIPYDKLPESEKEFDRATAMETIKLILQLGYKISKIK